jgi:serine protease Do
MNAKGLKLTVAAAAIATLSAAYSFGALPAAWDAHAAELSAPAGAVVRPIAQAALPDMSSIVANNGPAVVNISVSGMRKTRLASPDMPQLDPNDPFYDFFRRFGAPQSPSETPTSGLGSGFIVSTDGTILTNAHVVDGADEVTVKLTDKREFKAKVLGVDKSSDIAVLKIDAQGLPVVKVGRAAETRVGDWVLAIGSPFGFENTATAGIVSGKSRSLPDGSYVPFIQTDVAVNPGNSGGPLFNMAGEVIGVNSQIYSRSGGYQGLSFAIPIEVAMNVEQQIVAYGKVEYGRLGVTVQEVNQSLAESFGLKQPKGALIGNVDKDGPAAKAGLVSGDIILGINGKNIVSSGELPVIVANISPGETASLNVWRQGSERRIDVKIGRKDDEQVARNEAPSADKGRLGVAVRELTPDERRQADFKGGVVVEDVAGAAARAGIQPGDVVLSVNGEPISGAEELRARVAKAGKRIALLVGRGDARIFVPIDLG